MQFLLKILSFIKNNWKNILLIISLLALLISVKTCNRHKENSFYNKNELENSKSDNQKFQIKIDKQGNKLAIQELEIVNRNNLISTQWDKIEELSKINTQIKYKSVTTFVNTEVPIDRPIFIKDSLGKDYLQIPAKFNHSEKWLSLSGNITSKGLQFDTISFKSSPSIYIGFKRRNLLQKLTFKKSIREVVITDENPHVTVTSMRNITIEEKKHRFGLGVGIGYTLTPVGFQPGINFGINYNIIRF